VPVPTFFLSYSHRDDPSDAVLAFFEDLHDRLKRTIGGVPRDAKLGLFDRNTPIGHDWETTLSDKLSAYRALVSVVTLAYFDSDNCGKEVSVFARRHAHASLDDSGQIRDTTNILPIRWDEPGHFALNGKPDAQIHATFARITWKLPVTGTAAQKAAVERYHEQGMRRCVKPKRSYYEDLLNAFAYAIRDMAELPPAAFPVTWDGTRSAFAAGWKELPPYAGAGGPATPPQPIPEPSSPNDVVFFYLTAQPAMVEARGVPFADRLLARQSWLPESPAAAPLLRLAFEAAQAAASIEGFQDFHCLSEPQVPAAADSVVTRLADLNGRKALAILVVDEAFLAAEAGPRGALLEQIVGSERWQGPVAVVSAQSDLSRVHPCLKSEGPRPTISLSGDKKAMFAAWQSALIRERGRVMSASAATAEHETVPRISAATA
jgi:hypothetical protein